MNSSLTSCRAAPLRNTKIEAEEMTELRRRYPEIMKMCSDSPAGFCYAMDTRKTMEVPEAERLAFWEDLYSQRGFAKWFGAFADHLTDREANKAFSDFNAAKIRQRVDDPAVAEKLVPKSHGFGTRRVPLETNYFDVYNKPNVRLVDYTADSPIERVSANGIVLASGEEIELDLIIYATGFDAVTGALLRGIDLRGIDGKTLNDTWEDGVKTYLGLFVKGFPNMVRISIDSAELFETRLTVVRCCSLGDDHGSSSSVRQHPTQHRIRSRLGRKIYQALYGEWHHARGGY